MVEVELAIGLLGGFVSYNWPSLIGTMTLLLWLLPVCAFFATFLVAFAVSAPWKIHQEDETNWRSSLDGLRADILSVCEERNSLKAELDAAKPAMEFFFEPENGQHVTTTPGRKYRRIGLRNVSTMPVRGVRIRYRSIEKLQPKTNGYEQGISLLVHAPLARRNKPPTDEVFDLAVDESCDIDIASDGELHAPPGENPVPGIWLYHSIDRPGRAFGQNTPVPMGCYRIEVEAFCDNAPAAKMAFFVSSSPARGLVLALVTTQPGTNPQLSMTPG